MSAHLSYQRRNIVFHSRSINWQTMKCSIRGRRPTAKVLKCVCHLMCYCCLGWMMVLLATGTAHIQRFRRVWGDRLVVVYVTETRDKRKAIAWIAPNGSFIGKLIGLVIARPSSTTIAQWEWHGLECGTLKIDSFSQRLRCRMSHPHLIISHCFRIGILSPDDCQPVCPPQVPFSFQQNSDDNSCH